MISKKHTRTTCQIYSELAIKTPERRLGASIVYFEHISHFIIIIVEFNLINAS